MIKAKIKGIEYNIPIKWSDITYQQFIQVEKSEGQNEMISALTGIPIEIIDAAPNEQLNKLIIALQFVQLKFKPQEFEIPDSIIVNGKEIKYVSDIREKTFGQKIYLHEVLKSSENNLYSIIPDLVAIYSQPYIDDTEFDINAIEQIKVLLKDVFFVDLYSTAIGYINQLKQIIADEEKTLSSEPDANQKLAGVEMFQQFGVMNTIKALANNDITKYAEIEKLEYNTVFIHMRMNKVQNDFNDNYRKVLEQEGKNK